MELLQKIVDTVNAYLSDYILVILLIGTGLYFSIRTKFVQVRCFGEGMRRTFGKFSLHGGRQSGGLSSFQALATAIAAQVGTGNIVGACGAILIGGPGAIFWMWLIAFFGMATIYAEAILAQKTRVVLPDGTVKGGPVYYIKKAFKDSRFGRFLAVFFAVSTTIALGFIGSMVQSNSISEAIENFVDPDRSMVLFSLGSVHITLTAAIVGLVISVIAGIIFIGGAQRIAQVAEKLVPIMAMLYLAGGLIVIILRIRYIPETIGMIFRFAFRPDAIIGGGIGMAIKTAVSQGAKRGLFSNEAGMGSTPHAHALAKVGKPHDQGVVAMIGVFIDTFAVLTMTALVVISTLYAGNGPLAAGKADGFSNTNMAQLAFGSVFGNGFGSIFVAVCLLFFAFSTILGWNLFGKINFEYLFGRKATRIYSAVAIVFIFLGACLHNELVWALMDLFNNLMVLPNVLALIILSGIVAAAALNKTAQPHPSEKRERSKK